MLQSFLRDAWKFLEYPVEFFATSLAEIFATSLAKFLLRPLLSIFLRPLLSILLRPLRRSKVHFSPSVIPLRQRFQFPHHAASTAFFALLGREGE